MATPAVNVVRKYTVPRWHYTGQLRVPDGEEIRVEPDVFANSTKYRERLIMMSFGSPNQTPYLLAPAQPVQHPPWARNLLVDIGKSGCSDLNLVPAPLTALCGNIRRLRTLLGDVNLPRTWRLPTPYMLPRDEGLRVSVEYIKPQYAVVAGNPVGPTTSGEVTFIAKGYGADGYPAMLAARHQGFGDENRGDAVFFNSADLFNKGKDPVYLTEFCFTEKDLYYDPSRQTDEQRFFTGNSFNFGWTVNPSNPTFTQFMTQPRHIPGGLLAPMCRTMDGGSESPLVYFFPPDTWLDPKQAVSVRLANTNTVDIELHITLAGELEVI